MLVDANERTISYIRISVTDRCNFRCRYCLPPEGVPQLPHDDILRYEEIVAFMRVAARQGIRRARLTGGEPLVRRGVVTLVRDLAALDGLDEVTLTTNGVYLPEHAGALREAGLSRINIGLPSLDPDVYARVTRGGDLSRALAGLDAALAHGFDPVKINVVLLRGVNDDPAPFVELTRRLPVVVRFIEYMPIGPEPSSEYFLPLAEFHAHLAALGPFEPAGRVEGGGPAGPAMRVPGAPGAIAGISAMSEHFCERCNRLRLTADGHLRLCLFSDRELDLKPALRPVVDEDRLAGLLADALAAKPRCMPDEERLFARRMSQIGG